MSFLCKMRIPFFRKVSFTVKNCDCFFDVGLSAQLNHLEFDEFYKMCGIDIRTKNRFITRNKNGYIVCCKNSLMDYIRIEGGKKLTERLKTDCILHFDDDDDVCCFQKNDDSSELDYYCLLRQVTLLLEFS